MPIAASVSSRMTLAVRIFIHITALRGIDPDNLRVGERLTLTLKGTLGAERSRPPTFAVRVEGHETSWSPMLKASDHYLSKLLGRL
jgi:hypothetical protein